MRYNNVYSLTKGKHTIQKVYMINQENIEEQNGSQNECTIDIYYTSREDTLILLDESHVSKMLATCFSVGSSTAVTIRTPFNNTM